jgi:hypothetical protein
MNLNPPDTVDIPKLQRNILFEKPRITKFNIDWDSNIKNTIPSYNNYMFDNMNETEKQDLFTEVNKIPSVDVEEKK